MTAPRFYVLLDTNSIVYRNPLLRNPLGASLLNCVQHAGGKLAIPEIVRIEIEKQANQFALENVRRANKALEKIEAVVGYRDQVPLPTPQQIEKAIQERLAELSELTESTPLKPEHLKAALDRLLEEKPPNGPRNQQFKDSLIWESILEMSREAPVHFVTQDKDFYEKHAYNNGLAVVLQSEIEEQGGEVHAYVELADALEVLQMGLPGFDPSQFAGPVSIPVLFQLRSFAADFDVEVGLQSDFTARAFVTENPKRLALEFVLKHTGVRSTVEGEATVSCVARGDCLVDAETGDVTTVKLDELRLIDADGNEVAGTVYASAHVHLGGPQRVPYSIRYPI